MRRGRRCYIRIEGQGHEALWGGDKDRAYYEATLDDAGQLVVDSDGVPVFGKKLHEPGAPQKRPSGGKGKAKE